MKRYYAPSLDSGVLDAEQSHHCAQVMRQNVGDHFGVFDGHGHEAKARITEIAKDAVKFTVLAKAASPRPAHPVWLAQALTKGKSMDLIIEKATELGVSELVPLQSDHSVAHVEDEKADAKVEKWKKLTIEAAKQCGQNWLPAVHPPQAPKDFVNALPKGAVKLIASLQAEAKPIKSVLREQLASLKPGTPIVVMIGPEGDFTPAEIGAARAAGFLPVSLGKIILRAETAAFFVLSSVAYELME
ncbi:MAG TPA: 16S rRNA (uracil(1498)-N(3))-methyltransferase [Candidatus Methylacidiphilales bacterium]|jgi:16S rRNA (uracil1498-N3)-methyltransferase|nr:16S rRNA (uracil(1498)-N(3))-methyltransferase [Candidatus Methylacidiphilales bacterium]